MTALFIYLIKANIALCLFYLAYRLGLRRLTFYTLNRVFLVTGIVFSSLFPLVDVNDFFTRNETLAYQVVQYVPDFSMLQQAAKPEIFTIWVLLEWVFWTGVAVMGLRLLIQLVSLLMLHTRTERVTLQDQSIRKMDGNVNPFSFFRNIYVNPELHTPEELEAIVLHEQVHVKEWHSADVMMSELNNVFYWFNPGAWLMKTAVKENLEFLTDRRILRSGVNATAYQYSLVKVSAAQYAAGVANNFNFSHLKNRIKMMNKTRSSRVQLYRYGVLACVVCGVLLSLNYTKAGTVVNHVVSEVKEVLEPQKRDTMPPTVTLSTTDVFNAEEDQAQPRSVEDKFKSVKADEFQTINGKSVKPETVTVTGLSLAGQVSGIRINHTADTSISGKPATTITVRETAGGQPGWRTLLALNGSGSNTLAPDTGRQPLIVLDGKSYPPGKAGYSALDNLDANSIESIHVLKDKSAAALYGPAGQNGVLVISTKKQPKEKRLEEVVVTGYATPGQATATEEARQLNGVVVVGYGTQPAATSMSAGASPDEVIVTGYGRKRTATTTAREPQQLTEKTVIGRHAPQASGDSIQAAEIARGTKKGVLSLAKTGAPTGTTCTIYPNPTKGIVNISFSNPETGSGVLEVRDMNGRPVYHQSLSEFKGSYKGQVDLSRYPAGAYVVRLKLDGSEVSTDIVVKQ